MRHKVSGYKLGRTSGARVALRRNLMQQLLTHDRIRTTKAKAAAIRGETERHYHHCPQQRQWIRRAKSGRAATRGREAGQQEDDQTPV